MAKRYYVALYDEAVNQVMFVPNTPKGRNTLQKYKTDTTKAYRVGARDIEDAYKVFTDETGIKAQLVKIVYPKNIPTVLEIEL